MSEQNASDIFEINLVLPDKTAGLNRLKKEREDTLRQLKKKSVFQLVKFKNDPYCINLSVDNNKFIFNIKDARQSDLQNLVLSLSPYRRIIRDYFMIIDSYEEFRAVSTTAKLETVDMARRAIHNEAAEMLQERLADKITMDLETARGFFTLICCLSPAPRSR